eukprot:scaffold271010_cov15-Tisochrysis_lutea.AAC.1
MMVRFLVSLPGSIPGGEAQRAEGEAGMTETGEWSNGHVTSVFESGGDGILSAEDLDTDSMKLASALLAEKRQRQKE